MAVIKSTLIRGRRGRPAENLATKRWCVKIPEGISEPWDIIASRPGSARTTYGFKGQLVTALLSATFDAWKNGRKEIDITTIYQLIEAQMDGLNGENDD